MIPYSQTLSLESHANNIESHMCMHVYIHVCVCVGVCACLCAFGCDANTIESHANTIESCCRISSLLQGSFAKETYILRVMQIPSSVRIHTRYYRVGH